MLIYNAEIHTMSAKDVIFYAILYAFFLLFVVGPNVRLAPHGVISPEGVDMNVHKPGNHIIPGAVQHFLPGKGRQALPEGGDPPAENSQIPVFLKTSIDKNGRVSDQHVFRLSAAGVFPAAFFPGVSRFFE